MVRKGSPVRVRQRALRKPAANGGFRRSGAASLLGRMGRYGSVWKHSGDALRLPPSAAGCGHGRFDCPLGTRNRSARLGAAANAATRRNGPCTRSRPRLWAPAMSAPETSSLPMPTATAPAVSHSATLRADTPPVGIIGTSGNGPRNARRVARPDERTREELHNVDAQPNGAHHLGRRDRARHRGRSRGLHRGHELVIEAGRHPGSEPRHRPPSCAWRASSRVPAPSTIPAPCRSLHRRQDVRDIRRRVRDLDARDPAGDERVPTARTAPSALGSADHRDDAGRAYRVQDAARHREAPMISA